MGVLGRVTGVSQVCGCLVVGLSIVPACSAETSGSPETVAECIDQYSSNNGYGAPSDPATCFAPNPSCDPPNPETVALECSNAGVPCDPQAFITRESAECIAGLAGMKPGLDAWSAVLIFASDVGRPMWTIQNVTQRDSSNCGEEGESIRIDAVSGAAEPVGAWGSIC